MDQEKLEELATVIARKIILDQKDHANHHDFIKAMMLREETRQARWEKMQISLIGSVVLAVLGGIGKVFLMVIDSWVVSK
ncbi:MAG: hypothetical protein JKY93_01785 [Gammaproteobacteria bacterium]|nr:hypothetical protein [Gammaproteobacteria bacterium]